MLEWLFGKSFMPHGHCYMWRPDILWTHVISDAVIAAAYFSIPVTLMYFLRKRPDVPFPAMITLFAVFIVLCGTGHLLQIWTVWDPIYGLEGIEKAATAVASILTAVAIIPIVPKALAMRTPAQIQAQVDKALEELRETQGRLAKNERMASLGAVVAGVAHEINTPVGVGVTAASNLSSVTEDLRRKFDAGSMTRTEFERYLDISKQSADILLRNLQRASDLINSFKRVAVDQSSGERRRFHLGPYLDEILLSLTPQLKRHKHSIKVECPTTLMVDTYPGAIAQIVSNLVTNSLTHAFTPSQQGHIVITVTSDGPNVTLEYSDDGVGILPEHRQRVFEPFFTTKRDEGGSGLGLHIVYNLVTRTLVGKVAMTSDIGKGTRFRIEFPAQASGSPVDKGKGAAPVAAGAMQVRAA